MLSEEMPSEEHAQLCMLKQECMCNPDHVNLPTPCRQHTGTTGMYEKQMKGDWELLLTMGHHATVDRLYYDFFRMNRATFQMLFRKYGYRLEVETTKMRDSIPAEKRMAVFLFWVAHASSYKALAATFDIGKSTVVYIIHQAVHVFRKYMVTDSIRFPESAAEIEAVMKGFEDLCGLPFCAGAVDGTFVQMCKPVLWGDVYWCYKKYTAIIVMACVDAAGVFTYIDVGQPGSAGDAATWNECSMLHRIQRGEWLHLGPQYDSHMMLYRGGNVWKPYIVADSAFGISTRVMKCYEGVALNDEQQSFNYALIRTRRVVECAFGRLKGRFRLLMDNCRLQNPRFASDVVLVCCGLHNILERARDPREVQEAAFVPSDIRVNRRVGDGALQHRDELARYMHYGMNM
jgi:hypothetical protein